jgi:hypothetical protein
MSEVLNTKKRNYAYNGAVDSSDYNQRIEENYKDLVFLYNKANVLDVKLSQAFERVLKDHRFLVNAISDLSDRVQALELQDNSMSIYSFSQITNALFVGTSFAISGTELLTFDPTYNIITLPKIESGSFSKLKFTSPTAGQIVPDFFKALLSNGFSGVDTPSAVVDMTPIYNAILDDPNKVWKRNVVSDTTSTAGAQMMLYVKISAEISGAVKSNCIKINPYPAFGVEISKIEYTTNINAELKESDGWKTLNEYGYYDGDQDAIGKVPPGGWAEAGSDAIENSGPLCFYFPEADITAIRIKFVQKNYFTEAGKYIYTYGLSDLDIRYDKFLPTGRTMVRFKPKNGDLINDIISVTPKIYNVPLSEMSRAFSHRVIYRNGGFYSLDNPGASEEVWIEVTLNMLDDKTVPVLSDLIVQYD